MTKGSVVTVADLIPQNVRDYHSDRHIASSLSSLLADLRATFPNILTERRSISLRSPGRELVWMIAARDGAVMPDGMPFFVDSDDGDYSCGMHVAFDAWLAARGWYLERYDELWFVLTRLPTAEDRARWVREAEEYRTAQIGPRTREQIDPCPF